MRLVVLLALASCANRTSAPPPSGTTPTDDRPEGCHPLAAELSCMLPYPSDHWVNDEGFVEVPDSFLPTFSSAAAGDIPLNFLAVHPTRGASPLPPILAGFDVAIDPTGLVFITDDPEFSRSPSSATLLVEVSTGRAVAHFAELDPFAPADAARALVIRPLERLRDGAAYVVGVRGLQTTGGDDLPSPGVFGALRDGDGPASLQAIYDNDVFPPLGAAGFERSSLQLAWSFTVRRREDAAADLLAARAAVIAAGAAPSVVVDSVENDVAFGEDSVARVVRGHIVTPSVMVDDLPGGALRRDGSGAVIAEGTTTAPFVALVPRDALVGGARVIQFGHGFFGSRSELESTFGATLANRMGAVMIAVDWKGMSEADLPEVINDISGDTSAVFQFVDRVSQAMVDQLSLTRAVKGSLWMDPAFQTADAQPVYDVEQVYYYGLSMGSILGTPLLALSPDLDRAALGVGGASFSTIMFRGVPFQSFAGLLGFGMEEALNFQLFHALAQTSFDRIDPAVYAPWVIEDTLDGGPVGRRVLSQIGLGDAEVPYQTGQIQARALGIPLLFPSPQAVVYGLDQVSMPTDGSGLVQFDFGLPAPLAGTFGDLSATPNEVHDAIRMLDAGILQIDAFLRPDGQIRNFCEGACDPE